MIVCVEGVDDGRGERGGGEGHDEERGRELYRGRMFDSHGMVLMGLLYLKVGERERGDGKVCVQEY